MVSTSELNVFGVDLCASARELIDAIEEHAESLHKSSSHSRKEKDWLPSLGTQRRLNQPLR